MLSPCHSDEADASQNVSKLVDNSDIHVKLMASSAQVSLDPTANCRKCLATHTDPSTPHFIRVTQHPPYMWFVSAALCCHLAVLQHFPENMGLT